jgi:hypothetical protein
VTATMTFAGLDVHARSTHAAALDVATGELRRARFGVGSEEVIEWLQRAAAAAPRLLRGRADRLRSLPRRESGRNRDRGRRAGQDAARRRRPDQDRSQGRRAARSTAARRSAAADRRRPVRLRRSRRARCARDAVCGPLERAPQGVPRRHERRARRPLKPGAPGARPPGGRIGSGGDRPDALHQPEDGRDAYPAHPHEARRPQPRPGGRARAAPPRPILSEDNASRSRTQGFVV